MNFAGSWYPADAKGVEEMLERFGVGEARGGAVAAVAPHAGWVFSGALAAKAIAALDPGLETIAVIGGHMLKGDRIVVANEDAFDTPCGRLICDDELASRFMDELPKELEPSGDNYVTNTIELELPFVARFFPRSRVLWIRVPPDQGAVAAGVALAKAAKALGRSTGVVASTDLTHYGPDYGFVPKGMGAAARKWVREVNDAAFIKAVERMDVEGVLRAAEDHKAACSAGAVAAAIAFASAYGVKSGTALGYASSADVRESASFVGYAALGFYP
jgi:hypothetical protein